MCKKILYIFCALTLSLQSYISPAQIQIIGQSASFDEPEDGYAKVILLNDGRTAYVHLDKNDDLTITLYDTNKQVLYTKKNKPNLGKLSKISVTACFQTGSELAVFISEFEGGTPKLYRLLIDLKDGKINNASHIHTLIKWVQAKAMQLPLVVLTYQNS